MDATEALVSSTMSRPVVGVDPGTCVLDALELARERQVSHLPVVADGVPLGVVCACDLEEAPLDARVSAWMHSPAVTTSPSQSLRGAAAVMLERGVGSLLVCSANEIVGMLTRADLEREGLADELLGDHRCSACGSYQHVRHDARCGYVLCASCRRRSLPPPPDAELGTPD